MALIVCYCVILFGRMNQKNFNTTLLDQKDLGDGEVEAVIATGALDRHEEKIKIEGIDFKKYLKNPVVQWAHNYDLPPIGKATKIWIDGNKLYGRVKFAVDQNPFAKTVYDLIKAGFINAVSIGFIPKEMDGNTFIKSEMVEFSVVPVPANSEALISARKLGIDTDILRTYTEKSIHKNTMDLAELLKKNPDELTIGEITFLKEHLNDLTKAQVTKFASILKEEDEDNKNKDDNSDSSDKGNKDESANAEADAKAVADQKALVETVETLKKEVEVLKSADPVIIKNINQIGIHSDPKDVSKELKFLYYVRGIATGNWDKYLEVAGKAAMSTSDTSGVIAPAEFVSEIIRLEEQYGVARRDATVRSSASGAGIKYLSGANDVEIFDTAESGIKKSTKMSFNTATLLWRKFAAILPITDELIEDAAVDLWNEATQRFARAYAKREDQLVFTEVAAGGNTHDGITVVAGTNVITVANTGAAITFDTFVSMILGVPSSSGNSGKFYLNRTMLGIAMKLKDSQGRPLWLAGVQTAAPATILGRPYVETDVLSTLADAGAGDALAVYGDLKHALLADRGPLDVKIFDAGLVGDPADGDQSDQINLMTQDVQAMRVVKRMNAIVTHPAAFSVLKITGGS